MTCINAIIVQYFYQHVELMKFQSIKSYWDRIHWLLGGFSNFYRVTQNKRFAERLQPDQNNAILLKLTL